MQALNITNEEPIFLAVSDTPTQTNELPLGLYQIATDCDCRIRIERGNPQSGFTTSRGGFLKRHRSDVYEVGDQCKIAVLAAGTGITGTLDIIRVGRRTQ